MNANKTVYDKLDDGFFFRLVNTFYTHVKKDDILSAMYPKDNLDEAERHLALFLQQYWGGPRKYSETRGHPRLRMRHAPFIIDKKAHDNWLACMKKALDDERAQQHIDEKTYSEIWSYFTMAALSLVNTTT